MEKLYVSEEALQEKGKEYFKELDVNKMALIADYYHEIKYDGLLLSIDDMYDLHLSKNYEDICYTDVEDL